MGRLLLGIGDLLKTSTGRGEEEAQSNHTSCEESLLRSSLRRGPRGISRGHFFLAVFFRVTQEGHAHAVVEYLFTCFRSLS